MFDRFTFNRIPEISDEDLSRLAKVMVPIEYHPSAPARDRIGVIDLSDIVKNCGENAAYRQTAFTWIEKRLPADGYCHSTTTLTFHSFAASSLFKPSVAEVIAQLKAQLPPEQLKYVMGFSCDTENLTAENCLSDGYHFVRTRLFTRMICGEVWTNQEARDLLSGKTPPRWSGYGVAQYTHDGIELFPRRQIVEPGDRLLCRTDNIWVKEYPVTVGKEYVAAAEPVLRRDGKNSCQRLVEIESDDRGNKSLVPVEYFKVTTLR